MHRRFTVPGAVAAASLLLAIPASAASFSPGAPGIGDPYYPYYGNGGYDVSHYDLRLTYQPATDELSGTATISARTTQDLSSFDLDFLLDVDEVRVNGVTARFTTSGEHELVVTPRQPLAEDTPVTVVVRYHGVPSTKSAYGFTTWHRTPDGAVAADEPESAWWWFPSNDHPGDKATFDVSVAVPDGTQAISNGTLVSTSSQLGWTRYNWRQNKPQATYLTTLALGRFDITTGTSEGGVPVINAYSKDLGDNDGAARASVERTGELVDWLSGYFGPYPFDSAGGYVPNTTTGYALETQTRVYYSPAQFANGSNTSVVVHELAHQWYGDSVSVKGWKDIWINEGFARYAQWLWSEHEGEGTTQQLADYVYASHPADDPFWTVKPGDPGADHQFEAAVYDRGALAIQALRNEIGDTAFFRLLKGWPQQHAYGNASVADFVTYAEQVSGKPLAALFDTWLFQPVKPAAPAARAASFAASPAGVEQPRSWKKIEATNDVHGR
ncbi:MULTISPECIES: M1 family metallopeptidase [Streptomyces]|uniref:M1 family metallopeptidase n=1 Tax=Streptomyces TaxID=1883 RepID=UPI0016757FD2|nr:M1 family metallopeptidase [Streptomyces thermoviolaceus]WTD46522.1 M1 family metallopeptidase [Streptomyces thermoviolaceus]GGV82230.1 peptidase [Streptomyces thermoviolaceus subsp. apingens]